MKEISEIKN
jgi:hypothetical protein